MLRTPFGAFGLSSLKIASTSMRFSKRSETAASVTTASIAG